MQWNWSEAAQLCYLQMYKGAADQEWENFIAFVSNDGSLNYIEENISNSFMDLCMQM